MLRIEVSEPALVDDLADFLASAEWRVKRRVDGVIEASLPRALNGEQARQELAIYLATWRAMHRGATADLRE